VLIETIYPEGRVYYTTGVIMPQIMPLASSLCMITTSAIASTKLHWSRLTGVFCNSIVMF